MGTIETVSGADYECDPADCPSEAYSQNCDPGEEMCGYNGGTLFCYDNDLLSPPGGATITSSGSYSSCDGGYVIDCETYDGSEPHCDNGGSFLCDRKTACYSIGRRTSCTGGAWNTASCDTCRTDGNDHFYCDGSYTDGDGCEVRVGDSCGSGTGTVDSSETCVGSVGNCTSTVNHDCDNSDSDGNIDTCNGGNGCEITEGESCYVGAVEGTYSGCTCVVTSLPFYAGTENFYATNTTQHFLWGTDYGVGDILNLNNTNYGVFSINASGCIIWMDGTTACTAPSGGSSDGNVSSICSDNEVLLGQDSTLCVNLNTTIDDRDTDTTYSAGSNLSLIGTIFSVNMTQVKDYFDTLYMEIFSINASIDARTGSNGSTEWIKPEHIFDVDKADIETDLNTFVDIGGDTMVGDLIFDGESADIRHTTELDIYPYNQLSIALRISNDSDNLVLHALGTNSIIVQDSLNSTGLICDSTGCIGSGGDGNASSICAGGEHLDGGGLCLDTNATIDARTASTTYNATNVVTTTYTVDAGNVASLHEAKDGDAYSVSEVGGSSGTIIVNFTGVEDFTSVLLRMDYDGSHDIHFGLYECGEGYEEEYGEVTPNSDFEFYPISVWDADDHICEGVVSFRFNHDDNGNPSDDIFLDYIVLIDGFSTTTNNQHSSLTNLHWADSGHSGNLNNSGNNITADYFFGNGLTLTDGNLILTQNTSHIILETADETPNAIYAGDGNRRTIYDSTGSHVFAVDIDADSSAASLSIYSNAPNSGGTFMSQFTEDDGLEVGSATESCSHAGFTQSVGSIYGSGEFCSNGDMFSDGDFTSSGTITSLDTGTSFAALGDVTSNGGMSLKMDVARNEGLQAGLMTFGTTKHAGCGSNGTDDLSCDADWDTPDTGTVWFDAKDFIVTNNLYADRFVGAPVYFTAAEGQELDDASYEWSQANGEFGQEVFLFDDLTLTNIGMDCNVASGTANVTIHDGTGNPTGCDLVQSVTSGTTSCNYNFSSGDTFIPYTNTDTGFIGCVMTIRFEVREA